MKTKRERGTHNSVPPGFLDRYRTGGVEEVVCIPLAVGFLRLEYLMESSPPLLYRVAFTAAPSKFSPAIGNLLELSLGSDRTDETATFIAEEGVSGLQWSGGRVSWGHTYDDDTPPEKGEKIELGAWIDRCIDGMINPPEKVLGEMRKRYDPAKDVAAIRAGDEKARDRFWKKCCPSSEDEASLVLDLLRHAVEKGDGDIIFTCVDPLKRAAAGIGRILDCVTSILENDSVMTDFDRSELQEVLAAHSARADAAMAGRWVDLSGRSLAEKGPEALHVINGGSLFVALAGVPVKDERAVSFLRDVLARVEAASPEVRDDVRGLLSYNAVKKAVQAGESPAMAAEQENRHG